MSVQNGSKVEIHYTGTLDDGSVFDSSEGREPLAFTAGSGQVIKGFDLGVMGMEIGSEKTIVIESEDGYGQTNPTLIMEVPKKAFSANITVGEMYTVVAKNGQQVQLKIVEDKGETVIADFNHPLAGKRLTFKVKLVSCT